LKAKKSALNQGGMQGTPDEDSIGKYDALFGRQIKVSNPLLSPKLKLILKD